MVCRRFEPASAILSEVAMATEFEGSGVELFYWPDIDVARWEAKGSEEHRAKNGSWELAADSRRSALDHIQRQPRERSLLVSRLHIQSRLIHRRNHLIKRDFVFTRLLHGDSAGIDCFH